MTNKNLDRKGFAILPCYFKCTQLHDPNCRHTAQTRPGPCCNCGSPTVFYCPPPLPPYELYKP